MDRNAEFLKQFGQYIFDYVNTWFEKQKYSILVQSINSSLVHWADIFH